MSIRKGFFNKSGSACHKECRYKEQKVSPFCDPKVREKAKQTNLKKYGYKYASQNKNIASKISKVKSSLEHQNKVAETNLKRYGVENVFQSEKVKKQIEKTNIAKYGVKSPIQNKEIRKKIKQTCKERYGVENPLQSKEIRSKVIATNLAKYRANSPQQNKNVRDKAQVSFDKTIKKKKKKHYRLINLLRGKTFWRYLQKASLIDTCDKFNLNYQTTTAALLRPEFKAKYYKIYTFPTQQKQKELFNILKGLKLHVDMNCRNVIPPLELDIYIPDKQFAIEFNGSYWHSEAVLSSKEARQKHITKTKLCQQKNIYLFHMFECTWLNRKAQILNFIKSILGLSDKKIAARKCKLDFSSCKDFLNMSHIQGYGIRTIKYFNLVYNNQIVASMTAAPHHRQNGPKDTIILNRLAFLDDTTIQGGATRLFKQFKKWAKTENYKQIISWSDNTWTQGKIYKVLGFELQKEYGPDFFYWDMRENCYKSKQSQKKSATGCPPGTTGREWNQQRGFFRIWDCGKKRWTYPL
jgi:hypothetical protein